MKMKLVRDLFHCFGAFGLCPTETDRFVWIFLSSLTLLVSEVSLGHERLIKVFLLANEGTNGRILHERVLFLLVDRALSFLSAGSPFFPEH